MRFPALEQLAVPCRFERVVPGALHPDGRRYLPLIVLQSTTANVPVLGVVDRHHVVDQSLIGRSGQAQLVFLLSTLRLQQPPYHAGLQAEAATSNERPSVRPIAYGQVVSVPTWEAERERLPYETLYTELVLDIGIGTVGVRTSTTAADLAQAIGKAQIAPGDWIMVERSRIDILGFIA